MPQSQLIFTIRIDGPPVPKARPRLGTNNNGRASIYTPSRTKHKEAEIGYLVKDLAVQQNLDLPIRGEIELHLEYGCKQSMTSARAPDLDNLDKLVCDALNGIVYWDDKQVSAIMSRIHRKSRQPYTKISVYTMETDR